MPRSEGPYSCSDYNVEYCNITDIIYDMKVKVSHLRQDDLLSRLLLSEKY